MTNTPQDFFDHVSEDSFKEMGRVVAKHTAERVKMAKDCGIEKPALILASHEFVALVYVLMTDGAAKDADHGEHDAIVSGAVSSGRVKFDGGWVFSAGAVLQMMRGFAVSSTASPQDATASAN